MSSSASTSTALQRVSWPLVATLGAFALVRPLLSITGLADHWGRPATPLVATVVVTLVWIAAVGVLRPAEPVLTLVLAGVAYAVLAIVLSGILAPVLEGELQGPLARPIAIIPMLAVNAVWGGIAGVLAAWVVKLRS